MGLFELLSGMSDKDKNKKKTENNGLMPWEQKEVDNKNYEPYNFEEEDTEEEDYYSEDDEQN